MNRRTFLKAILVVAGAIGLNQTVTSNVPVIDSPKYRLADYDLVSLPYMLQPVIMRSVPAGESIEAGNAVYFGPEMDRVYQGTDRVIGVALNDASAYDTVEISKG